MQRARAKGQLSLQMRSGPCRRRPGEQAEADASVSPRCPGAGTQRPPGQMGLLEGAGQGSARGGSEEAALSRALSGRVRRGLLSDRALPGGLRAPPATQRTISAVPLGRRARPRSGSGGPPGFPRQKLKGGAAHGVGTPLACGGRPRLRSCR